MKSRFFRRFLELKTEVAIAPELPFAECLTADAIKEQLKELGLPGREQIYSHCTTLLPLHHSTPTAAIPGQRDRLDANGTKRQSGGTY